RFLEAHGKTMATKGAKCWRAKKLAALAALLSNGSVWHSRTYLFTANSLAPLVGQPMPTADAKDDVRTDHDWTTTDRDCTPYCPWRNASAPTKGAKCGLAKRLAPLAPLAPLRGLATNGTG